MGWGPLARCARRGLIPLPATIIISGYGAGLLLAALLLSGCSQLPSAPVKPAPCETCIGPYDLLLCSHREALGVGEGC